MRVGHVCSRELAEYREMVLTIGISMRGRFAEYEASHRHLDICHGSAAFSLLADYGAMPSSRQEFPPAPTRDMPDVAGSGTPVSHIPAAMAESAPADGASPPVEIGGRDGPEPTRFGDWERRGRCIDF